MKRTQEEINRQIEGLKKDRSAIPQYNFFGDNNWARMDAMVAVLEGGDVSQFRSDDIEDGEDGEEIDEVEQGTYEAQDWLTGHTNDDLFDSEEN